MTDTDTLRKLAEAATQSAPWEIEEWLVTIAAHCTVIKDGGDTLSNPGELSDCIKTNIDEDLRPAIVFALTAQAAELTALRAKVKAQTEASVRDFALAILHGDDIHRAWLIEAAECFIQGRPLPKPRDNATVEGDLRRAAQEAGNE